MPLFVGEKTDAHVLRVVVVPIDRLDDLLLLGAGSLLGGDHRPDHADHIGRHRDGLNLPAEHHVLRPRHMATELLDAIGKLLGVGDLAPDT
jgi:hypothetical protein